MKRLPIGIENFKKLRTEQFYYIDKTMLIEDVLRQKVCLYTRPRRFGKTLNMSMLYYFFSNKEKESVAIFQGLSICDNQEAIKYQNQYPVIFLTLKDIQEDSFEGTLEAFYLLISDMVGKFAELLDSPRLNAIERKRIYNLLNENASKVLLSQSLKILCQCLKKHYGKNVIILIDEYDVPLHNAYLHGYYEELTGFLRTFLGSALKTNDALEKAILTGCLRIAKESIFTGLNNFSVHSILDETSSSCFGFTQNEIDVLLDDYQMTQYQSEIKKWYDGYLFGDTEIYNPWSCLMYVNQLTQTLDTYAQAYWANTSGNDIIYHYIKNGTKEMKDDFDVLISGGSLKKKIRPELTYREMDDIHNIYSFLLFSGYLRIIKRIDRTKYELSIPNYEIRIIYKDIFQEWARTVQDSKRNDFIRTLLDQEEEKANEILNDILLQSMSYYDSQESFYHGFMIGFLSNENIYSNIENGDGRCDIKYLPVNKEKRGFILELKVCKERDLYDTALEACQQIVDKRYLESDRARGYQDLIGYGIAFEKKRCFIKKVS